MPLDHERAKTLFEQGEFLKVIQESGRNEVERRSLPAAHRIIVANALALNGHLDEALRLAAMSRDDASGPVRSQAEWILGLTCWRAGDMASALLHTNAALRLAQESRDTGLIAWSSLHVFRLMIDSGAQDAIMASLTEVRRHVARAALPHITIYLHNCVAVLEGQIGHLDEARRHLDIAQSLLDRHPNAWLEGSLRVHRATIAYARCEFQEATVHFKAAQQCAKRSGHQQQGLAADTSLGFLEFLTGNFHNARKMLSDILMNADTLSVRLGTADGLARLYLALNELDRCDETLRFIEGHVLNHPELASVFYVRWAPLSRARLLIKQKNYAEALTWFTSTRQQAERIGDVPLEAAARLGSAHARARAGDYCSSSRHLMSAETLNITQIPELQPQYYYGSSLVLRGLDTPLQTQLRDRALRVWADQGVVSVRLEMDDGPSSGVEAAGVRAARSPKGPSAERVADSLAAFSDLAHRPRLLGEEMVSAIRELRCSPDVKIVETRGNGEPPQSADDIIAVPLGSAQKAQITLVCRVPDEPVKAILLADVLRIGRAALALERAREEERSRAALWPAPPVEEQAGALFLTEEMQTLLATARRIAPTTVPVLITGETGTGKEVLARTIHAYSSRAAKTFLPFNCSSVPKDMLDSQLFGHRRGSFTGATDHFPGVIRAAAGGTLFLDEIGETTLDVQPKLLRFLESNEVHPIGEGQPVRTDVRVIAATNADLDALVAAGRFREDLFYRLNIVRLHVPPLRERRVEIAALAHHYLQKHAQEYRKGQLRLAEETMEYLVLYRWPGNVRQLANEMRRMAALAEADAVLMPEHLAPDIAASRRTIPPSERTLDPTEIAVRIDQPLPAAVQHLERAMIQHAIRVTGGRMEETAALLGVSRKGLYLKRLRYGLEPPESAAASGVA